jgi:hypothetical protein
MVFNRFLQVASIIVLLFGIFFVYEGILRLMLPYNELGRYFDVENAVVYHEGTGAAYVTMGILACVVGGAMLLFSVNKSKK